MRAKQQISLLVVGIFLALFAFGCKKEAPPPPTPPPPAPPPPEAPAPSVSITAEPSSIERGKSATLKWSSTNAASAELNQGIGAVATSGNREIFPTRSTEYTVTVKNADGKTASASAMVTVRAPPPPIPPLPPKPDLSEAFSSSNIRDALFDYDKSDIRPDTADALRGNATAIKSLVGEFPAAAFLVEGHCDERGTTEYNLALGDRRSTAATDFLVNLGVPASKLSKVSLGEERPVCSEESEACYQRNRRARIALR
jgi:peptidoglycan-associated lipoprotein